MSGWPWFHVLHYPTVCVQKCDLLRGKWRHWARGLACHSSGNTLNISLKETRALAMNVVTWDVRFMNTGKNSKCFPWIMIIWHNDLISSATESILVRSSTYTFPHECILPGSSLCARNCIVSLLLMKPLWSHTISRSILLKVCEAQMKAEIISTRCHLKCPFPLSLIVPILRSSC